MTVSRRRLFNTILASGLISGVIGIPKLVTAAVTLLPECALGDGGCGTCDFIGFFANLTEFLLQFLAVGVLLMIVIGGVMWIVSAGNDALVTKGKQILVGAVVGTLIALSGYFIINAVIATLTGDADFKDVTLFSGTDWNAYGETTAATTTTTSADGTTTSSTDTTDSDPTGVVTDCSSAADGTACAVDGDGCFDGDFCVCYDKGDGSDSTCITTCEYSIARDPAMSSLYEASCQYDAEDDGSSYCTDTLGGTIIDDTGAYCPETDYPVCCKTAL